MSGQVKVNVSSDMYAELSKVREALGTDDDGAVRRAQPNIAPQPPITVTLERATFTMLGAKAAQLGQSAATTLYTVAARDAFLIRQAELSPLTLMTKSGYSTTWREFDPVIVGGPVRPVVTPEASATVAATKPSRSSGAVLPAAVRETANEAAVTTQQV